jgi:hypothetical protein
MKPSMRWLPWSELGLILIEHVGPQQQKSGATDRDFSGMAQVFNGLPCHFSPLGGFACGFRGGVGE